MVNTTGIRRGTRYMFARDFRKRGKLCICGEIFTYNKPDNPFSCAGVDYQCNYKIFLMISRGNRCELKLVL